MHKLWKLRFITGRGQHIAEWRVKCPRSIEGSCHLSHIPLVLVLKTKMSWIKTSYCSQSYKQNLPSSLNNCGVGEVELVIQFYKFFSFLSKLYNFPYNWWDTSICWKWEFRASSLNDKFSQLPSCMRGQVWISVVRVQSLEFKSPLLPAAKLLWRVKSGFLLLVFRS